tara:strand:+ start:5204 stop:5962 length:759 start_codon:yes stop_codon:yes gene_type:complete
MTVLHSFSKFYYLYFSKHSKSYKKLVQILGYCPYNIRLYQQAFLHNSHSANIPGIKNSANNERLEYLGDAVLDLIIAELLFKKFPFKGEGFLTEMRSKSVSRKMLSTIAFSMGLQDHLVYSKSISKNQAAVQGMAGNALEALIGAVYLDGGYTFAKRFVKQKIVNPYLDFDELKDITVNFKSLLNQYAQKEKKELDFKVLNPESEKKIKTYSIAVCLDGVEISTARGKSKKVAEQIASEKACVILKLIPKAI